MIENHINDISDDDNDEALGPKFNKIEQHKISETKEDLVFQKKVTDLLICLLFNELKDGYSFGKLEFVVASYLFRNSSKVKRKTSSINKFYPDLPTLAKKIEKHYFFGKKKLNKDHLSRALLNLNKIKLIEYRPKELPNNLDLSGSVGAKIKLTLNKFNENKKEILK